MILRPAKRLNGRLQMPGDKSISHRAALLAGIAAGSSRITNYSTSADCASTLACLSALGVRIARAGSDVSIEGAGDVGLRAPNQPLDCGNSGTTMRMLAGILAGQSITATLTGDDSLRTRPMQRIIDPLDTMGARIDSSGGRAPLVIHGGAPLQAIHYELAVASAQVKSCLLLAGLKAQGRTTVIENDVTRDHTERMLQLFGAAIETGVAEGGSARARYASVTGPARLHGHNIGIPGDISSAAYFVAAASLLSGSTLEICNVGINPTRTAFLQVLNAWGLNVKIARARDENNEPVGDITVRGDYVNRSTGQPLLLAAGLIPGLIDELPLLAVVGSQVATGIEVRNAKELRVKESDRITATVEGLRAMGADVEEFDDGLRIAGSAQLRGASINSRGDHRIAMSFAVAALLADGETEIKDADCVAVSFPEFFELLNSAVER